MVYDITGVTVSEIKNMALFSLGFPDVVDFSVLTNPTVMKVDRIYPTILLEVMSSYQWRFAIKRACLSNSITSTFTAATSDILTTSALTFANGHPVTVSSTTTLPAPLVAGTTYYTVSSTGFTCKLSATLGGTAIDITSTGAGTHTLIYLAYALADDTSKFKYNYPMPTDMLTFNNAFYDADYNNPINEFETNQSFFNTDVATVYLAYNALVDETTFPQYFIYYFKYKLALELCNNLTGDSELLKILAMQEQQSLKTAKLIDARQNPVRTIKQQPLIAMRR
jgi:hypothetical protein